MLKWGQISKPLPVLILLIMTGCDPDSGGYSGPYLSSPDDFEPSISLMSDEPLAPTPILPAGDIRKQMGLNASASFERAGLDYVGAMLADSGARTLEPLRGQPLKSIDLTRTPISDLAPLNGMPLESVSLVECPVQDLSPLENSPLVSLDLSKTSLTSLSSVGRFSQLRELYLEEAPIEDLMPLRELPLEKLWLANCPVSQLAPLQGKSLAELNLCGTRIDSLRDLQGAAIQSLWLRNTRISDLTPLAGSRLVSLDLQGTPVSDLTPLAGMDSLERLNLTETDVTDLTPLKNLRLVRLIFSPERITQGIDGIREMKSLQQIDVSFDGMGRAKSSSEFWELYDAGKFNPESRPTP